MKIIITEEQFEKNKQQINIVNFSDIVDSGSWSPQTMTQKKEGREKFYFENNQFIKDPELRSSKLYYLNPKIVGILNDRINKTIEKYTEYIRYKRITDAIISDFTSDVVKYSREKKEGE